ncbi:MAG: exosortase C-terminal domain/associated protein EpsI [Acidobacteriota bacterium]
MNPRNNTIRFWTLLVVLLMGGSVINLWERAGEARVSRRALKDFPAQMGSWRQIGGDMRFDDETEKILRADDYLSRNFESNGRVGSFYVGYYATQRNGATYHSPLNCLPGSGWTMSEGARITITPQGGGPAVEANRFVVQNGQDRALMIYWYQGRGRTTASEYWGKIYTIMDSVGRRRSDGAMVRVMVQVRDSEQEAQRIAVDLASLAAGELPAFVPN